MAAYAAAMWRLAPRVRTAEQFFAGRSRAGQDVAAGALVASIVISWIFAKSITNAANLGFRFGAVGAIAYAGWYLSIPIAGLVIYRLRTIHGARSLPELLSRRYGRAAAWAFLLIVLVRLLNEVWSNTAVIGSYFGAAGTPPYLAAATVFTLFTLLYTMRGGLRGSILTDVLQFVLGIFLLVFVIALILPHTGVKPLVTSGHWTLAGGVDLLLVAVIQSFSYPFHDPVLTDRGFLTRPRVMLRSYLIAGLVAAAFIAIFGLTGIYAKLSSLDVGQDAPLRVAQSFGVATLAAMTVLMMVSAGSTLDSTLSSFGKALAVDTGEIGYVAAMRVPGGVPRGSSSPASGPEEERRPIRLGRWAMVAAVVLGSIPLFTGATILKATTVSGTMVLGLAPVFLLIGLRSAGPFAFHFAFWPGVALGIVHALDRIPASWSIGEGSYAGLLGVNVYGSVLIVLAFLVGAGIDRLRFGSRAQNQ
ncbi:MAG: sodium:solute symporter [Candidatus Eisenbacteria bacterium]|uniref:Sodium:solute symporter n=1 Tax=Eiseniibacteriota bacterium TaxID=2212470 RepID=A0A956LWB5_UNCEI|nr:sodium:solute symporter [Candidatus Eisenbacteria bacterium]